MRNSYLCAVKEIYDSRLRRVYLPDYWESHYSLVLNTNELWVLICQNKLQKIVVPFLIYHCFLQFSHMVNNTNTRQDTGQIRTHSMGMYVISLCWETRHPKSFLVCHRKHLLTTCLKEKIQEKTKILRPTWILSSCAMNLLTTFPGWVRDLSPISSDKAFLSKSLLPILNLQLKKRAVIIPNFYIC